jgi:PAT family beta-lactamase induction signal transducer AmpG
VLLAFCFLGLVFTTALAPKPEENEEAPRSLRDAVWQPFVGFLSRPLALEILAFVVLYKLSDVMANALLRPFLHDMGYNQVDRGVVLGLVTWGSTAVGALLGGVVTTGLGVARSLWLFGVVQALSNIGYVVVAMSPVNRPLMLAATGFETLTSGMGTGAFSVLLLRLTQKRFSATQYSLMSSLFALPRILAGPIAGLAVDAVGWVTYFWIAVAAGIPGLFFLRRFAPLGGGEPNLEVEEKHSGVPITTRLLVTRGIAAGLLVFIAGAFLSETLTALKAMRATPPQAFDLMTPLAALARMDTVGHAVRLIGLAIAGAAGGLFTSAVLAARRGTT